MQEPFRTLPRQLQLFLLLLIIVGLALTWWLPLGRPEVILGLIIIFAAAGLVAPVPNPSGGINVPNLGVIIVAAMLWEPQEVLLGVGVGSILGQLFLRRNEIWRAVLNGALWGVPGSIASLVARTIIWERMPLLLSLTLSAIIAVVIYRIANMGLFALYRSTRFHLPFFRDWGINVVANWPSQLLSAPVAIVLAIISRRIGSIPWGLGLTAISALGLPVARMELAYYQKSRQTEDEIVEAVVRVLEGVDPTARAHGDRVSTLAVETGRRLGMSERELLALRLAARLHDIGLIADQEDPTDDARLVSVSSQILKRFPDPMIAEIVQARRDRWDGRGNLSSRSGMLIPTGARILAAAEIYDCAREGLYPYEKPRSPQETVSHIISLAGTVLDPKVVMVVIQVAAEKSAELSPAG